MDPACLPAQGPGMPKYCNLKMLQIFEINDVAVWAVNGCKKKDLI